MTSYHTNPNDTYIEIGSPSGSSESNDILPQTSTKKNSREYTFTNTNTNRNKRINNLKKLSPSIRRKTRKFKNVSKSYISTSII